MISTGKKASSLVLLTGVTLTTLMPSVSFAELEAEVSATTMHLFRGKNESGGPAIVGEVNYQTDIGLFAGAEIANTEENNAAAEVAITAGYQRSFGGVNFGIGYTEYTYPGAYADCDNDPLTGDINGEEYCSWEQFNESEVFLKLGYAGFGIGAYIGSDDVEKARYYSLGYNTKQFGIHVGIKDHADPIETYTDFNVRYNFTDAISLTVSVASGDAVDNDLMSEGPLFVMSYTITSGEGGGHGH